MSQDRPSSTNRKTALETSRHFRREFVAAGASVGTVLLAGCAATTDSVDDADQSDESGTSDDADETDDSETSDDADETGESAHTGNFRLLVTDLPADIGDFERLDVSFDSARVFDGEEDSSDDSPDDAPDDNPDDVPDDESDDAPDDNPDDTPDDNPDDAPDDDGDSDDSGGADDGDSDAGADGPAQRERGFYILDLDGATVDLTQVVGDRAMPVFDGELSPGTYNKIELHVSDVEGIVDGEQAEVKVPSEKLQITKPFEVRSGGTVEFVFDINVVRRGQQLRYNLTPVISGSGVNGEDVDVEDVSEEPAD